MTQRQKPDVNSLRAAAISRRGLLAAGAAVGGVAPLVVSRHVLGGEGHQAPSDTLRIAAVGIGCMGQAYLAGCKT